MEQYKNNVIMGAITDYPFERVAQFVLSLRSTGFDGDIIFFVSGLTQDTENLLMEQGVHLQHFMRPKLNLPFNKMLWPGHPILAGLRRNASYWVDRLPIKSDSKTLLKAALLHYLLPNVNSSRYFHYLTFLNKHPEIKSVLLCDVRDVFFQSNPFDHVADEKLHCFLEHTRLRIKDTDSNAYEVRMCFGEAGLERIGHQPISCCGTTLGGRDSMLQYLSKMVDELSLIIDVIWHTLIDQAVHNKLLWTDSLGEVEIHPNGNRIVLTCAGLDSVEIEYDEQNRVIGDDGIVISVLHQYDRVSGMTERLMTQLEQRRLALQTHVLLGEKK